jgi:acyl-CoA thioesterase
MESITKLSEERKNKIVAAFPSVPFARLLGLELLELHSDSAILRLPMRDELRQPYGLLHGGAIASLIDTATAFALLAVTDETEKGATSNLTVHYLKAHSEGAVTCIAKVVKSGRRLVTLSAEVHDEDGSLIATAISTYAKV